MTGGTEAQAWLDRAILFELLSLAFLPPTREVAGALCAGEFAEACGEVAAACGLEGVSCGGFAFYRGREEDEVFHELRREYTRLFMGAREPLVTPYAGVRWAHRRGLPALMFVGPESMAIERFMRARGVVHAVGAPNEPLDHIGSMCEFASFLCLVNAGAVAVPEGARVDEGDYGAFCTKHLAPFALWLADEVPAQSPNAFFRSASSLLAAGM